MDASIALSDAFLYLQINLDQDLSDRSSPRPLLAENNEAWEKENTRILQIQAASLISLKCPATLANPHTRPESSHCNQPPDKVIYGQKYLKFNLS